MHIFIFICLKDSADKHTRRETTKIMKENSRGTKQNGKHAECDHVKPKNQSSEAESFKHMKINI
jgi:hypothetical protein